jgi:hypothetical protein
MKTILFFDNYLNEISNAIVNVDSGELVLSVDSDENNMQIIEIPRTIQRVVTGCELKFLSENPDLDKEGLIRDRKVNQGGGD